MVTPSKEQLILNQNSSHFLPELNNLSFGIGTKDGFTAASVAGLHNSKAFLKQKNRKQNLSMTIEASNIDTQSSRHEGLMPTIKKPTVQKFMGQSNSPAPKMFSSIHPSPKGI